MEREFSSKRNIMTSPNPSDTESEVWPLNTSSSLGNASSLDLEDRRVLHFGQFSPSVAVLLAVLMSLVVLATVVGNALVILAFVVDKNLRTQGNFFFLNLAIADFLVGGFCIPVYIPYVLTGKWILGRGLCKLWLVVDYLLCTASVFNIVLISFDRFISVTRAVSNRCQKGVTRNAVLKMICVWLAAFLLYGPAIISWEYIAGSSILPDGECYAEFYFNGYFLMTASAVEFFTPFISVTYFNLSIYINIRKRTLIRNNCMSSEIGDCEMAYQGKSKNRHIFFVKPAKRDPLGKKNRPNHFATARVSVGENSVNELDCQSLDLPPLNMDDIPQQHTNCCYPNANQFCDSQCRSEVDASIANRHRLLRDKKVAKSLAVIVCVFGLCWAPYTLLMIIRAVCHAQCVQHYLYEISFWLLWLNSSINPILYPLCHISFRKAFMKLLCPRKMKIQPQFFAQKC
ncbi:histamine H3 receptor [Erpetoichthys calabaricus]|uniref:Histamine H3 receptor n=1 Tax=Erpetoichthys calabaricus TaxID=27687 RepID=A0A8C4X939_ERPCA|nr:histamine H3 receptor [Erpetoichthys calabaricus]